MNFQTADYIDWFRENWHDIDCDLATSGMHPITQVDMNILVKDLNIGGTLLFGHPKLVELISDIYGIDKVGILITSGATHANFLICALLISEGDEVIVENPVYTPLIDVVKACKAKVKFIHRKFEEDYRLNMEKLNEMISKDTKMVVITNLHNPSGMWMDHDSLKSLSDIAKDTKTYILSDEVYKDFMLEDAPPSLSSLTEFGISTGSLSKFYGAPGLRVGWAMCSPTLAEKMRKINDYLLVANSSAGEHYGALILENRRWFVDRVKKVYSTNFPIVKAWLDGREDLEWFPPRYGVIGFPRLVNDIDSMKLSELLLKRYKTMLSPGRFFGADNHIRIGFGGDEEKLRKGLENVSLALNDLG